MKKNENIETRILKLFGGDTKKTFSFNKLFSLLPKKTRREKLSHSLRVLKKQGKIIETDIDIYQLSTRVKKEPIESKEKSQPKPEKGDKLKTGVLDITRSGMKYVIIEGVDKDPIIREREIPAFSGDTIAVKIKIKKNSRRDEAKFIKVVERKERKYIGKVEFSKSGEYEVYFVKPHDVEVTRDFYISNINLNGAKDGDNVIVEMTEWKEKEKNPRGRILRVLSDANTNELEMQSILLNKGFDTDFPEEVQNEVKKIDRKIGKNDMKDRIDFRNKTTFTIDPDTARDFDDALSVDFLENEHIEIGIHIADVSHYVKTKTNVNDEAYSRATSVYLPNRVAPMLPEFLSNDLCSLNPNEDKLAFSVILEVDKNGKVHKSKITQTVIHSDQRFTYEDAQSVIETKKGKLDNEILACFDIAGKWRKKRFERGSINFHSSEVKFVLDDDDKIIDIIPKIQKEANWLIEEFMLKANIIVAEHLEKFFKSKKISAGIYRNHDSPDMEKLLQFKEMALKMSGKNFNPMDDPKTLGTVINEFLDSIEDESYAESLNKMAIRSMAKADYGINNIGHFGLAFSHYSHFTSPIRRYPDLIAHRLLKEALYGYKTGYAGTRIEEMALHCSEQERKAVECERDGIRFKQLEYLANRIGNKYEGVVSGVHNKGFWVEIIENKCEGFVELESIKGKKFGLDTTSMTLFATDGSQEYMVGDKVTIKVKKVDVPMRKAWFVLV